MTKARGRDRGRTKVVFPNERQSKLVIGLLCVGLSVMAVSPFFFLGKADGDDGGVRLQMPDTHDMQLHFEQMKSFYRGLAAGEIYPRWEEDTNRGFGAPTTTYYPPGVYYLTAALYAILGDWWRGIFNAHLIMMIASAAALYLYARRVMSRGPAALAMASYIFFPYHLVDQYHRGAIAEFLGFVWMPLMLLFAERILDDSESNRAPADGGRSVGKRALFGSVPGPRLLFAIAGLAASYAAFLWTHTPTAYQFSLAFGLVAVVAAWMRRNWNGLLWLGAAVVIGLALSAAYLYPAAVEQNLIHREYISQTWPYHNTYVFKHQLPYADATHPFFRMIDTIWAGGTISIVLCGVTLLAFGRRSLAAALKERVVLWTIAGCFAAFMMTSASYPIGRLIPKIDIGVFTWRMLSIISLSAALLAGACAQAAITASNLSSARRRACWSLALVILIGGVLYSAIRVVAPLYNAPLFGASPEHLNYATLPMGAPEEPLDLPEVERAELASQGGSVTIGVWNPEHRELTVNLNSPDSLLIRTFNFPGWAATVDGKPTAIVSGEVLGDIMLQLEEGGHAVQLDYRETPTRQFGDRVTIVAFTAWLGVIAAAFGMRSRKRRYARAGPTREA